MNWIKDTYFKCFNIPTHGLALAASVEWPGPGWNWWVNYDTPTSFKYAINCTRCTGIFSRRCVITPQFRYNPFSEIRIRFKD